MSVYNSMTNLGKLWCTVGDKIPPPPNTHFSFTLSYSYHQSTTNSYTRPILIQRHYSENPHNSQPISRQPLTS